MFLPLGSGGYIRDLLDYHEASPYPQPTLPLSPHLIGSTPYSETLWEKQTAVWMDPAYLFLFSFKEAQ